MLGVVAAVADAGLNVVQRWCSASIGESLIYDLRSSLFAKVLRMPIAFFTRTPTGAITSRLSNDVVGAQTAVTTTLGNVVSNVIGLVTSLAAMLVLEWRLTLLALCVLPLFVIPARRVGRRLQDISREQMQHNAAMSTQMTERFNVAGAVLVKLFGDDRRELASFQKHAGGVRDTGIRQALYGRVFFVALGLVAAIGAVAIYGVGGHLVVSGSISTGTLVALAALVTRVYTPLTALTNARVDLMTSMVNFERVFEVLDAPEAISERPGAIDLPASRDADTSARACAGDVRCRALPLPAGGADIGALAGATRSRHRPRPRRPRRDHARHRPRRDDRPRRRLRRRQVDDGVVDPAPLRRHLRSGPHRRPRRPRPHAGVVAPRHRSRQPGPPPLPRVDRREPALRQAGGDRRRGRRRRRRRRASTTPSPDFPTATTPSSASAATGCRAARSNASPSPACSSRIPR